jgi:hypothetical protein
MVNILNQLIQEIEAREEFYAPIVCAICWNNPVSAGAVCADCIFSNRIKITEGSTEKDSII